MSTTKQQFTQLPIGYSRPSFKCPKCKRRWPESKGYLAYEKNFDDPALYCLDCCKTTSVTLLPDQNGRVPVLPGR